MGGAQPRFPPHAEDERDQDAAADGSFAAVSCGIIGAEPVLDLDYAKDFRLKLTPILC